MPWGRCRDPRAACAETAALIAPDNAAQEHAAELAQGPEAAIGNDPLGDVAMSGHGTDADAGDYLNS